MKLAKISAARWEAFAGDSNMVLQHCTRRVLVIFKLYLVHRSPYSTQASETRPSRIHTCCVTCKCFPAVCINLGKLHMSPVNILIQADCLADRRWSQCKPSNKCIFMLEVSSRKNSPDEEWIPMVRLPSALLEGKYMYLMQVQTPLPFIYHCG